MNFIFNEYLRVSKVYTYMTKLKTEKNYFFVSLFNIVVLKFLLKYLNVLFKDM